jgi:hypothetical protein
MNARALANPLPVDDLRGQGERVDLPDPRVVAQPCSRRGRRFRQGPCCQIRLDRQLGRRYCNTRISSAAR